MEELYGTDQCVVVCGDGRSAVADSRNRVLQCAASGTSSVGLELNTPLVLYSKYRARRLNVAHLAKFHRKDIFKADLTQFRSAVIFGAELLMDDLVPKLDEMLEGSYLIACRFPLPRNTRWKMIYKVGEGIDSVWLYQKCAYIVEDDDDDDDVHCHNHNDTKH